MVRACLTVSEYPGRKKQGGGVDDEKVECSVVNGNFVGIRKKKMKEEKGGRGGCHPKPHIGWF